MKVILTKEELQYIKELAKKRNAKATRFGDCTYRGGRRKQGGLMAHFVGLAGEYAVCKSTGSQIDTRIFEDHGDEGVDLLEEKWGVKTSTYVNDPLLRVEVHHFNEDIEGYILCAYKPEQNTYNVEIVGWASRDEVKQARQRRLGPKCPLNYILSKGDLHEWDPSVVKL